MKRANIGAERYVNGWDNFDIVGGAGMHHWDIRKPWDVENPGYDYAVCNHVLNHLDHHELLPALTNMRNILRPYGTLRIMVPNLLGAIAARTAGDRSWFPQDERIRTLDAALCTYITWFGTQKSVFTPGYLVDLIWEAGFSSVSQVDFEVTASNHMGIMDLDDRENESLFMEAVR